MIYTIQKLIFGLILIRFMFPLVFAATPSTIYAYYEGRVLDTRGASVPAASIQVTANESPDSPAALFQDSQGQINQTNPLIADGLGRYSFFIKSGTYNINIKSNTYNTTWTQVGIFDPEQAQKITNSDANSALTLVESDHPQSSGNSVLQMERHHLDGSRMGGPWSLFVNQGPTSKPYELRWIYNSEWNESLQSYGPFLENDIAYAMRFTFDQQCGINCNSFSYDYAPLGIAGNQPQWQTIVNQDLGGLRIHQGPFVVGDGLQNSSLIAKRVGWFHYFKSAPSGVLSFIDLENKITPEILAGEIVNSYTNPYGNRAALRTTQRAEMDAGVFQSGGNGTPASTLNVGKTLARIATGSVIQAGDLIVSSDTEPGRAMTDNAVTDPRRIIGFAIESAESTLAGYVAIVRVNQ